MSAHADVAEIGRATHADVADIGRAIFVSSLGLDKNTGEKTTKSLSTPTLSSQQRSTKSLNAGTTTGVGIRASTGGKGGGGKPGMVYPTISVAAFQANTPLTASKPSLSPKGGRVSSSPNVQTQAAFPKKRASSKMSPRSRKSSDGSPGRSVPSARSPPSAAAHSPGSPTTAWPQTSGSHYGKGQGRNSGKSRGSSNASRRNISIRISGQDESSPLSDGRASKMNADAPEFISRRSSLRAEAPEFMPIYQGGAWPNPKDFLKPKKMGSAEELEVIDNVMAWAVTDVGKDVILSPMFLIADVKVQIGIAYEVGGLCQVCLECETKTRMKFELSVNGKRSGPKVCLGKKFSTTIKLPEDEVPRRVAFQALEMIP